MTEIVMLAHTYDEDKHKTKVKGWWISEKYDGVCGLFKQKDQKMYSRKGNVYSLPPFITEQLIETGIDLHGEIWFGYNTFDLCSGLARKENTDDPAWEKMTFMVFDTPDPNLLFEKRLEKIENLLKNKELPNIKKVHFYKYESDKTTIEKELSKAEEKGAEGLVLRRPGSKYENKRSHDMLKVKSWIFDEAIVTGYKEGTGRLKGMVGSLKVNNTKFKNFYVGTGLNDWQRQFLDDKKRNEIKNEIPDYSENEDYINLIKKISDPKPKIKNDAKRMLNSLFTSMPVIGDVITFRYKETTEDGNPKFPSFVGVRDYE